MPSNPPATTSFMPPKIPLAGKATQVGIYRVTRDTSDPSKAAKLELMPNLLLTAVSERQYAVKMAQCRYIFDNSGTTPSQAPQRIENVYPFSASGRFVVKPDDELLACTMLPNKQMAAIAFGFAQACDAVLNKNEEAATFAMPGIEFRHWDSPLPGAVYRDSDGVNWNPTTPVRVFPEVDPKKPQDIQTDLPIRFNPDGRYNATPMGSDSGVARACGGYATFVDPEKVSTNGSRQWTLAMATRYIIAMGVKDDDPYLLIQDLSYLDKVLTSVAPAPGKVFIDWTDPSTYVASDIIVQDLDVTGECWPSALRRLLEPYGFGFFFCLFSMQPPSLPKNLLVFFRNDNPYLQAQVFHQKAGEDLDAGKTNVVSVQLSRDSSGIENEWRIMSEIVQMQVSLILMPLFAYGDISNPYIYRYGDPGFPGNERQYRWFGVDEAGLGHYQLKGGPIAEGWYTTIADLKAILQPGATGADPRTFVHRKRKPRRTLISTDSRGDKIRAKLEVSVDYPPIAGLWNPNQKPMFPWGSVGGTWQEVTKSGSTLLDDQLGIEITAEDPSAWPISSPPYEDNVPFPNGAINVLQSIGNPNPVTAPTGTINPQFVFRLTCVIDTDHDLDVVAKRHPVSPTKFPITRFDDARDRFQLRYVTPVSAVFDPTVNGGYAYAPIDDSKEAQAHADSRRKANELAVHSTAVSMLGYNPSYQIGQRITAITGRGINLNMNNGSQAGETPVYPVVIGRDFYFGEEQTTVLQLGDTRAEPPPERGRANYDGE